MLNTLGAFMVRLFSKRVLNLLAVIGFLLAGVPAMASAFTVSPTRISLSDKQRAVTVRLLNTGDETVTVQAHVMAWNLKDNTDVYLNTDDLLLNPPIFTLKPKQPQLMRVGLRHLIAQDSEVAYRLIVEEVPPVLKAGTVQMRTILRIAIPVFIAPRGAVKNQLQWGVQALRIGGIKLSATNAGNTHIQIKKLELQQPGTNEPPVSKNPLEYLLPGKTNEWTFDEKQLGSTARLTVKATTDAGEFNESLAGSTP